MKNIILIIARHLSPSFYSNTNDNNMQKTILFILIGMLCAMNLPAQTRQATPPNFTAPGQSGFRVDKTFHIGGLDQWDYISVGPGNNRIYVSHGTQVNVLDETTGDSVGVIPGTSGVHGIAFAASLNKGFTSNGRLNNVTVFDLRTNQVITQIATGRGPDAIMYDDFSKKVITCNSGTKDLSVIDPSTDQVVATIVLPGSPETAVSDGSGKIFVNIFDKGEISEVNIMTHTVEANWSIAPANGLAIDVKTKRLFANSGKLLIVVDASNGKVVDKLPIGEGCDGVCFDNGLKYVFASCGEGKLSIIQELSADRFKVIENVATIKGARTSALDEKSHTVFLPGEDALPRATGTGSDLKPGTFQVLVVRK
jgi:DNA-binding beta-propeller fold protein YncE